VTPRSASPAAGRGAITPPADSAAPGSELATGYRVIEHLSRGRRLDVYDAWSHERDCRVVLKTLRPDRAAEAWAGRTLVREGRLLMRFTHPHLVRAYEVTRALDDGRPVVVLETLGGETLSHLVHRLDDADRRLPLGDVAILGLQLASALAYLHRQGWLHLDLKPANIVNDGGRVRLIDLSITRRPGRGRRGSGTREYMSPEQARGGWLTPATDVWGLGAVLFDALAAEPPYGYREVEDPSHPGAPAGGEGTGTRATDAEAYPVLEGPPRPVRSLRRVPRALGDLVDGCLRLDAAERPSLAMISDALAGWLEAAQAGQAARASRMRRGT
jgi:eukaryotic-like serine/threonine-protein kinase